MSARDFFAKLSALVDKNESLLCVGLDPTLLSIPKHYYSNHEPVTSSLLRWNRAIIEETHHLVCAYKPNIAFYEALGAPGLDLLRKTLALIPSNIPVILDAKRGDIGNTAEAYAQACFDVWDVDAVTLNPYLGRDSLEPFLRHQDKGLFVLCHTSNPSASDFQQLEISDWRTLDRESNAPLYVHVARTAAGWGKNVGLVMGATYPEAMQAVRQAAPESWFLVPGIGVQGGALEETLDAGLRPDKSGLLMHVGRAISHVEYPGAAAQKYRSQINRARSKRVFGSADLSAPRQRASSVSGQDTRKLLEEVSVRLVELGAVKFGSFTLASGIESPIYIDLRLLISEPPLLAKIATAYAEMLPEISFDRLAGVPYAALPIATAISLYTGHPMIYPRKEAKAHGLGKDIEGNWQDGERILIVEDLITSGGSIIQSAERLRAAGMVVEDCIVLLDREQGGEEKLAAAGIRAHCVFRIQDMLRVLVARELISIEVAADVRRFLAENQAKVK